MVSPLIYLATRLHQYSMFDKEVLDWPRAHQGKQLLVAWYSFVNCFRSAPWYDLPQREAPTVLGGIKLLKSKHPPMKENCRKEESSASPEFFLVIFHLTNWPSSWFFSASAKSKDFNVFKATSVIVPKPEIFRGKNFRCSNPTRVTMEVIDVYMPKNTETNTKDLEQLRNTEACWMRWKIQIPSFLCPGQFLGENMGVSEKMVGFPISHPKSWSFLVGKPMVVGLAFQKPPHISMFSWTFLSPCLRIVYGDLPLWHPQSWKILRIQSHARPAMSLSPAFLYTFPIKSANETTLHIFTPAGYHVDVQQAKHLFNPQI